MDSKEAKDRFNCNPSRHRVLIRIACWFEFPAANGLRRALVQSKPNAPNHSNV
jgi:hypothetical protein